MNVSRILSRFEIYAANTSANIRLNNNTLTKLYEIYKNEFDKDFLAKQKFLWVIFYVSSGWYLYSWPHFCNRQVMKDSIEVQSLAHLREEGRASGA